MDDLLRLEDLGQAVEAVVRHLDDADVQLEAAVAAGLGVPAGERVENGRLAGPGKPDDGDLHAGMLAVIAAPTPIPPPDAVPPPDARSHRRPAVSPVGQYPASGS